MPTSLTRRRALTLPAAALALALVTAACASSDDPTESSSPSSSPSTSSTDIAGAAAQTCDTISASFRDVVSVNDDCPTRP